MLQRRPVAPAIKEVVLENVPSRVCGKLRLGRTGISQVRVFPKVRKLSGQRVVVVECVGRLGCEIVDLEVRILA
jgi:hypothetical protein